MGRHDPSNLGHREVGLAPQQDPRGSCALHCEPDGWVAHSVAHSASQMFGLKSRTLLAKVAHSAGQMFGLKSRALLARCVG